MKKIDFYFLLFVLLLFAPFFISEAVFEFYKNFNHQHPLVMSALKFMVLATMGELIGLRIKTGAYFQHGFGVLPRAVVWAFIGITIKLAFVVFVVGVPFFLEKVLDIQGVIKSMSLPFSSMKLFSAFAISVAINTLFAPVFMTFHKITDVHIVKNGGSLRGFFRPIPFEEILTNLDWKTQWNFIFKKTIPFFWIPAHTVTFLLPSDYQVLFAAFLGIILGILLSWAAQK